MLHGDFQLLIILKHGHVRDGRATYCLTLKRPQISANHASFRQILNFPTLTKNLLKWLPTDFIYYLLYIFKILNKPH